jgi:peptidoglycan/xylan/chitin deacetylase (PgdA/CDA1 family)
MKRGLGGLRRAAGQFRNRSEGRVLILLYHRVAKLASDPWGLAVTPRRFAEHLEVLRQHARPMRLRQLCQALRHGNLPDRSVVVTFDDGYADNLHNAKPLLERHDVPATVFVASGFVESEREFWWDELTRLLLHPGALPERLRLSINGNTYRWELGEAAYYGEKDFRRYRGWRAWKEAPSARHSLYTSLCERLRPMTEGERRRTLDDLRVWAGVASVSQPGHRPLSLEGVVNLDKKGLVEVGAHTVTHPALSTLPMASQRYEIRESKARLEKILNRPVTSFAYPYGKLSDYTAETIDVVRKAGFACACSSFAGLVERSSDPFQLPRVYARNWDGDRFATQLSRWFGD